MSPGQLDREPVYRQIAGYYADKIRSGEIAPGEQLPSVAQLCKTWGVANGTAVMVAGVLREQGLAETRRRGTFVIQAK